MRRYKHIKQNDMKDCGAACIATICRHHGLKFPISRIREVAGTDKQGTSAYGMIKAAEKLGFSAKGVKGNQEAFFEPFPLPAVAHVIIDQSLLHYVVIHRITKKEIIIADPAKGIVKYTPEDFFKIWTGVLILMAPSPTFEKGDHTKGLFARFFGLLLPQKRLLFSIFLASLLYTALGILGAFYFRFLLDEIVPYILQKTLHIISIGVIVLTVKGNGVVRPNEKVSSIKNKVAGKVSKVHYKAGQKVKKGDLLLTLESKDVDVQDQSLQKDYDKTKIELAGLQHFKESLFSNSDVNRSDGQQKVDFQSDQVSLQNLMLELNGNRTSYKQTENSLTNMQLLDQSIRAGQNLFKENDSEYYNKYQDYDIKKKKLENTLRQQENAYVTITKTAVAEDVKAAKKQFDDARLDLDTYVNGFQLNLRSSIEESKRKLETISLERDKVYVELNNTIQADQDKIKKLDDQLAVSKLNSDDREIKASADGVVNVLAELREGELVGAGTEIATIVPEFNSEYTVQVSMSNKDIAKIKSGDKIKYHFLALPYKEYGELSGTITTVGADAIVNPENGSSFYAVEAAIVNKPLYNSKGEETKIKPGMIAEVNVVTNSKKILYYLLEKIDLKE